MKILILGKKGMAGQTIYKYLKSKGFDVDGTTRYDYNVISCSIDHLYKRYDLGKYDYVINCIGYLNHEENMENLIKVNSWFPHELERLSKIDGFNLIHISSDCYKDDTPYGHSKWLGELKDSLTLRTSIIGHDNHKQGTGLLNWILKQSSVEGYINHLWYGITTLELAKVIEQCFNLDLVGIVDVTNGIKISKKDLLNLIKDEYNLKVEITPKFTKLVEKVLHKDHEFRVPSYKQMIHEMRVFNEKD